MEIIAQTIELPGGIALRPCRMEDAADSAKGANNEKIVKWMRNAFPFPYSESDATSWLETIMKEDKCVPRSIASVPTTLTPAEAEQKVRVFFTITLNGAIVGGCGLNFENDVAERITRLGYWIAEDHWGKGIMTTVVKGLVEWTWVMFPYLLRIDACVYSGNEGSEKVLAKSGFEKESVWKSFIWKWGKVHDLHTWVVFNPRP